MLQHRWHWTVVGLILLASVEATMAQQPTQTQKAAPWKGVHVMAGGGRGMPLLRRAIEEVLVPMGVNVIVIEADYGFEFQSHPELRSGGAMTKDDARSLAALCRKHGIRLIPQFSCLGHQSWAKTTYPLLVKYPQFDETPDVPKDNPGIYCRSWCPLHPDVNKVVFALMDELLDAFQADALHVRMDEVFLIGSDQCPRCKGKNPAELFAKAVNDYHGHLVGAKKVEMLMWGDRLLDDAAMKYGEWESARNGTAAAIDKISKDIVICDWHYSKRDAYLSVPYFQEKGFRVWPAPWKSRDAAEALMDYAAKGATDRMLGVLCTTWTSGEQLSRALLPDADKTGLSEDAVRAAGVIGVCMERMKAKE